MTSNPLGGFFTIVRRSFHTTKPLFVPRKGFWLDENAMNSPREKTNGKYSPAHMVYGDKSTGDTIELEGQLTSDKNSKIPYTKKISDTNLSGKNTPQKVVKFDKPQKIAEALAKEIPGSEAYFNRDDVKNSLDTLHSSKINGSKEE